MAISTLMAAALEYAKKGKAVFPCAPGTKKPLTKHGFKDATTDEEQIRQWWTKHPDAWIGMPTGEKNDIFVIDVDVKHGAPGLESLAALEKEHGKLPDTLSQTTASGGRHFLFEYPKHVKLGNSIGKLGKGIDTRGAGGYIIVAPSPGYKMADGAMALLATLPSWVIDMLIPKPPTKAPNSPTERRRGGPSKRYGQAALNGILDEMRAAGRGERNSKLNVSALRIGSLVAGGCIFTMYADDALNALADAARDTGLGDSEIRATILSGYGAGLKRPFVPGGAI